MYLWLYRALVADLTGRESAPASEISFTFNVGGMVVEELKNMVKLLTFMTMIMESNHLNMGADTIIVVGTVGSRNLVKEPHGLWDK